MPRVGEAGKELRIACSNCAVSAAEEGLGGHLSGSMQFVRDMVARFA